jgi:hypothetical protein
MTAPDRNNLIEVGLPVAAINAESARSHRGVAAAKDPS